LARCVGAGKQVEPREIDLKIFMRFVLSGVCLLGLGGYAGAQSAREFWPNEWQRQQSRESPREPSWDRSGWGRGTFQEQREWFGGQQPSGYSRVPEEQSPRFGNSRPDRRKMPTVRVSNPDFFTYVPDRLVNVALGAVCEFKTAANAVAAPDTSPQDSDARGVAVTTPAPDSSPAAAPAADFLQACAAAPAISVRMLPQVSEAIARYYAQHPQFIWSDHGSINAKAQVAIAKLAASDAVGLDPADYRVAMPDLHSADAGAMPPALLRFELALSAKVLTYVLDATRGRIDPNRLSGYHDLPRKTVDLVDALATIAQSSDIATDLESRNPDNAQFRALVAELARQREDQGKTAKLRIALEQMRWLPRQLGTRYVFLNQPAFEVSYFNGAAAPLTMRAVIGKPSAQTYFFTDRIKEITYNPYWNVPRSIVINEMLPKLWRNPSYLDRLGYEVSNSRGREVASSAVDWSAVATQQTGIDVRQPPGPGNALGRLKIDFPNKHAIYLHDTNQKHLFAREQRALSHGCVRLEHPREMAAALLGTRVADIDRKIATEETQTERVQGDIPVYLAYFTAWPDAQGNVRYYKDVYDRDTHLAQAITKTTEARNAP
jgi:murein L,D-transpeptidase YcbB/YkuD